MDTISKRKLLKESRRSSIILIASQGFLVKWLRCALAELLSSAMTRKENLFEDHVLRVELLRLWYRWSFTKHLEDCSKPRTRVVFENIMRESKEIRWKLLMNECLDNYIAWWRRIKFQESNKWINDGSEAFKSFGLNYFGLLYILSFDIHDDFF